MSPVKFANVSQSVSLVARTNFPTRAHAISDSANATIEHPSAMKLTYSIQYRCTLYTSCQEEFFQAGLAGGWHRATAA